MAAKNLNLAVKLKAIDKLSGPLKNVAGASGQVIESLKKTQERLKAVDSQTDQFNAFRQLRQQSVETKQSLNQAQSEVQQLAMRMKESAGPAKLLKKDLGAAEQQVAELAQQMKSAKQPSDLLTHQFKEAQKEANRLGKEFRKAERDNKALSKEFDTGRDRVNQLQQAHTQETQKLQQMRQSLNKAGVSTKGLADAQAKAKQESSELNKQFDAQAKKLERISQIENKVAKAKSRMQKSMQVSANVTVAAFGVQQTGQTIKQALSGPLQVAADFEEQMAGVGAVANASDADLAKLTATSRKLGAATSFSASESAEGMKYLAMAGFKTNQIIATMPGLLNLAKAGTTDLGAASDIASDILSGFGLKPEQMGRVSDVLTATFTTANTNLTMLGETMKYVGPVARQAGMSLEETSAMAGLLGNVGIKSSQAGTTLRAMVTRLAAPTGKAAKRLQSLGIETKDASGNMRNMIDVIGDMAEATDDMGSAEKLQALKDVFGEEPAAGMAELLSQEGAKGITKYLDVVSNSQGRAAQVANKMGDNAKGKLKELSSAYESLQITLGNALLPVIKSVAIWMSSVARGVDKWAAAHPGLVRVLTITAGAIGVLATVGGPLLLAFASLNSIMAMTRYGMVAFSATSKLMSLRLGSLGAVTNWYSATNTRMSAGLKRMATGALPAFKGAVLGAIGRVKALALASLNFGKTGVTGLVGGLRRATMAVITFARTPGTAATGVASLGRAFLTLSTGGVVALLGGLKAVAMAVLSNPLGILIVAVTAVAVAVYRYWEPIKAFAAGMWDGFIAAIGPLRESIGPLINVLSPIWTFIKWIGGGIAWLASGFMSLFEPVNKTTAELEDLRSSGQKVGEFIASAFNLIPAMINKAVEALGWFSDAWSSIFGDDDAEKTARIKQINDSPPITEPVAVKQAAVAARLEAVKPKAAESQEVAAKKVSTPKAVAAAGVLAASSFALPAAAGSVPFSYQTQKPGTVEKPLPLAKAPYNQSVLVKQAAVAARLEAVKPKAVAPQEVAAKKVSTPKAIAAAGVLAASAALPAAAEPVQLAPTYQETVAAYKSPAVSGKSQASIPNVAKNSQPAMVGGASISIGQLDINVQGTPGMDPQEIAAEVRKQFIQLMHEQQAQNRGGLYDA